MPRWTQPCPGPAMSTSPPPTALNPACFRRSVQECAICLGRSPSVFSTYLMSWRSFTQIAPRGVAWHIVSCTFSSDEVQNPVSFFIPHLPGCPLSITRTSPSRAVLGLTTQDCRLCSLPESLNRKFSSANSVLQLSLVRDCVCMSLHGFRWTFYLMTL